MSGGVGTARLHGSTIALAGAETIVWAGLYYLFPALLLHFERDLGNKTALAGAFTAALLLSALAAPVAGRIIDRGFGRELLTGSALAGGLLLVLLAAAETMVQFYLVWLGLGLAMAGCLYEPCFAHVTHVRGAAARLVITRITLVAGFAGTVSFPIANLVAGLGGWRASALVFAGLILIVGVPLMWLGAAAPEEAKNLREPAKHPGVTAPEGAFARAAASPVFWLLAAAFTMVALNHGILITHLLPLLAEREVDTGLAVIAVSLIGPMQVLGRLLMLAAERRVSISAVSAISFIAMSLASSLLLLAPAALPALFLFVALQGAGYGVTSITRPAITAVYLGRVGFGVISGALATAFMGATALAPTVAALIWTVGGYDLVLITCIATAAAGLVCFGAAWHYAGSGDRDRARDA